jgi:hypothetical protein
MIGIATSALFVGMCLTSVVFSRVACTKAKEQAVALDFLIHYVETVKALPFAEVRPGVPINALYDGSDGAPRITIPGDASWISIDDDDFETFHPDLAWFRGRNPEMQVILTTTVVGGSAHTRHMKVRIAWDAPLERGGRTETHLDMVKYRDL